MDVASEGQEKNEWAVGWSVEAVGRGAAKREEGGWDSVKVWKLGGTKEGCAVKSGRV